MVLMVHRHVELLYCLFPCGYARNPWHEKKCGVGLRVRSIRCRNGCLNFSISVVGYIGNREGAMGASVWPVPCVYGLRFTNYLWLVACIALLTCPFSRTCLHHVAEEGPEGVGPVVSREGYEEFTGGEPLSKGRSKVRVTPHFTCASAYSKLSHVESFSVCCVTGASSRVNVLGLLRVVFV